MDNTFQRPSGKYFLVVESLSLEVFKSRLDVTLSDMVSKHGGDGLIVELEDLKGLFRA